MDRLTRFALLPVVLVLHAATAAAQISPGPLATAHEELEGVTNCLKCHGIGEHTVDDKCLECHQTIRWLRDEGRGLHGRETGAECRTCHLEHGGRDFELVHWENGDPEGFDHAQAGWALDGKHAETKCRTCHASKYHAGPVLTAGERPLKDQTWLGLQTACFTCHADPHEARLGNSCVDCHNANSFREMAGTFSHDQTRYPLKGAHVDVKCEACHQDGYLPDKLPAFATCNACHADPHGGRATIAGAATDCETCHGLDAFHPATFTAAMHRESRYPLEGKHASVSCAECHGKGTHADASGAVRSDFRFRPVFARCMDCHDDEHGGQLTARADGGSCETCHDVGGFATSLFTVTDHESLDFPLHGSHASVKCKDCHGPERPLLPAIAATASIGPARVRLHFASLECAECHRDPHDGRFDAGTERGGDKGCVTCHDFSAFALPKIDAAAHATYRFPLEGAHAAVPCFDCHKDLQVKPSSTLKLAPARHVSFRYENMACADCHDDPHGAQFAVRLDGGACESCHGLDAFVPASAFDHDKDARFPLEGAHEQVACAKCHFTAARKDGTEGPVYRPIIPHRCEDCHRTTPRALTEKKP